MATDLQNISIPDGWRLANLGDVAEIAFSPVDKKTVDGEEAVQLCNYTDVFYNRQIRADFQFMEATANATEIERWRLKRGDVLFTKDSETADEIGIPSHVVEDMPGVLCGYHLGLARPKVAMADGGFLAEALRIPDVANQFSRIANGVTRFGLTLGATLAIQILLPPLPEQRAIAEVLDSIDEAIERAETVITSTEQLRDALLHELLTKGIPGWHTEWKDAPNIGQIPACWEVARLGDVCEKITKGTTPTTLGRDYVTAGVRFLRVENISDYGAIIDGKLRFIDEETHRKFSRSVLKENDVVLSIAGALGRSALIPSSILPANINQALSVVRLEVEAGILPNFLVLAFRARTTQLQIAEMRAELAQANLNLQQVADLRIIMPTLPEQQAIAETLDGVESAIDLARTHVSILRLTKESAGDALLTGRVRVRGSMGMRKE